MPNAATVYADLKLTGSRTRFTGSDHYPIVGDYNIVPAPPLTATLTADGFEPGGLFQVEVASAPNVGFEIQASTDLSTWSDIGSGDTDSTGKLIFEDPNDSSYPRRFYPATSPIP